MRLAIVGCGSIGTRHLKNALALGCEVEVVEPDYQRILALRAEFPSVHVSNLLAWREYDAVIVSSPYRDHLFPCQRAVEHRKPFFVEKPLGSLDQIEDWRRLVQASEGLTTQVGYQCRFHPKAQAMKLLFPKPESGSFGCYVDMGTWPGKAYGPLWLEASHELDMALHLGAEANVVRFDSFGAILGRSEWTVEIVERDRYLRWWSVGDDDNEGVTVEWNSPAELGDEMYLSELKHFLDCVREGRPTDVPLKDGLRVLEVCKQIEEMAACPR